MNLNIAEYARLRGISNRARERHVNTRADREYAWRVVDGARTLGCTRIWARGYFTGIAAR